MLVDARRRVPEHRRASPSAVMFGKDVGERRRTSACITECSVMLADARDASPSITAHRLVMDDARRCSTMWWQASPRVAELMLALLGSVLFS